jgi:multidrug efflux pump subunit AcrB
VQVDLDQRALHSYGLSAQDVGDALAAQNQITPVGTEKISIANHKRCRKPESHY